MLTPSKAAEVIGCSPQQVRTLIRKEIIKARKVVNDCSPVGYVYYVDYHEALRYKSIAVSGGYPRGRKRNPKTRKMEQKPEVE